MTQTTETTDESTGPIWAELYQGSKRVKLPLQAREERPENPVTRRNYRRFESREVAIAAGLAAEHEKFGHDRPKTQRGVQCPRCSDE